MRHPYPKLYILNKVRTDPECENEKCLGWAHYVLLHNKRDYTCVYHGGETKGGSSKMPVHRSFKLATEAERAQFYLRYKI